MTKQKTIEQTITDMVEQLIADSPELFLVKVILKGNAGNQKLIVLLDGDNGVTIDQCGSVSRGLSAQLEEYDLIDGKYLLEVSSAGLDFPLESERQYRKNIGRSLKIKLEDGTEVTGELKEVNGDKIVLLEQQKKAVEEHEIEYNEIDKSMVLVSFK